MKNKRRNQTQTQYAGTETGSVTFTVTFYPDVFDEDKEVVAILEKLAGIKQTSPWLRTAAIQKLLGNGESMPVKIRSVEKEAPIQVASANVGGNASDKAAAGMGLKFGRK